MALTFDAAAEVFLNINMHSNNIFFVFLDFVRLFLAICSGLEDSSGKCNRISGIPGSNETGIPVWYDCGYQTGNSASNRPCPGLKGTQDLLQTDPDLV